MDNIKIAQYLLKMARDLVAISMTRKDFKEYSDEYSKAFGESPNPGLFDLFKNNKQLRTFQRQKKRDFPHLKEFVPLDKIRDLLDRKMMCIVSAGRNELELREPELITDAEIKKRYRELLEKLETMRLPYYEVYGLYFGDHEISYLVDLTDDGRYLNDPAKISANLKEIRNFCHNHCKQDSIIEGIGNVTVFQYVGHYNEQRKDKPENDPYNLADQDNAGRSTLLTRNPGRFTRRRGPDRDIRDVSQSFSKNYDFDRDIPGTKY